ncbi:MULTISPECIES: septation protein A [Shewanella]|jgi:intracellular septation protein|uniref:Inner membrane-spanning protein YciB n=1 Tax=Shewanella chilikensis TaxID=558541 RepID=A0A6G7LTJ1_9GAMM|nr:MULTISPECIES: septation protein A [Shewanella]MBZ4678450.1 septation protein [Shewanella sp.]MCA0952101.1 septation protein A [Shewanella chilikensis]MCE9787905.1 septation protein A [Shewanella chilikensis]MCE9851526.1 septation protein A [Shewanella chilikensis]MCL1154429.1 septation protein A [Shewanella chilikensis]
MKQLLDFLPLVIFFAVYKFYDIYVASGALIAATALQLVVTYLLYRKLEKMHLITFAMVAVFGTLTLVFHDDTFIKWKVTIVYALFALGLGVSQLLNKPVLKGMLGQELKVADKIWAQVTWYWVSFFIVCGLINIYVAFSLSQETWVNFKVFGLTAVTLLNTIATVVYLFKHIPEEQRKELK